MNRLEGRSGESINHQRMIATLRTKALRGQPIGRLLVALSRPFVRTSFFNVDDRRWLKERLEGSMERLAADYLSEHDMRYLQL